MRSNLQSTTIAVAALASVLCTSCTQVTDGIEVSVAYQMPSSSVSILTDMAYRVRLERGLITVVSAELIRCEDDFAQSTSILEHGSAFLQLFAASRARAHTQDTPTLLGSPTVLDVVHSDGVPITGGVLRPPPGRYCGVRLECARPDDDAAGLPSEEASLDIEGIVVAGTAEHVNTHSLTDVSVYVSEFQQDWIPFEEPLELDADSLDAVVVIHIDPRSWFDGADIELLSKDELKQQMMDNVGASFRTSVIR